MGSIKQIGNNKHKLECECDFCHKIFISKRPENYRTAKYTFCPQCTANCDKEEYTLVRLNHPIPKRRVIPGINDLYTYSKDNIDCFENKELAKTYSRGTHHRFVFRCPVCGNTELVVGREMSTHKCKQCIHDSLSYPNKFIRALMKQLTVDYLEYEYSPEWIKPYRYDCYFELKNQKYIVEMDGGIGHGFCKFNSKEKDTEGLERDKYKDERAFSKNIIVIRIDSRKSNLQYIKDNITNSLLSEIFDLSKIDWEMCHTQAIGNWAMNVCNYYKNATDDDKSTSHIAKVFDLDISTVQKYLNLGTKVGLCFYDKNLAEQLRKKNARKGTKDHAYRIRIKSKEGEMIGIFTMCNAVEFLREKKNPKGSNFQIENGIRQVCRHEKYRHSYLGYVFEYA